MKKSTPKKPKKSTPVKDAKKKKSVFGLSATPGGSSSSTAPAPHVVPEPELLLNQLFVNPPTQLAGEEEEVLLKKLTVAEVVDICDEYVSNNSARAKQKKLTVKVTLSKGESLGIVGDLHGSLADFRHVAEHIRHPRIFPKLLSGLYVPSRG